MLTDPPRFSPAGNPVYQLRATLPVASAVDGSPILPGFILWAFALNEGDLLAVSPGEVPDGSCRFISYAEGVWSAAEGCAQPWPYVEELLRRPMATMGPGGALRLPADVRWVLDLDEGDELACRPSLAMAEFEPCALKKLLQDREVTLSPSASLRLRQWVGLE